MLFISPQLMNSQLKDQNISKKVQWSYGLKNIQRVYTGLYSMPLKT